MTEEPHNLRICGTCTSCTADHTMNARRRTIVAAMTFKQTSQLCRNEYGKSIKDAITAWRNDGFSQAYIADRLGVTALTVRSWAKRYGITFDRRQYNAVCRGGTEGKSWRCRV